MPYIFVAWLLAFVLPVHTLGFIGFRTSIYNRLLLNIL